MQHLPYRSDEGIAERLNSLKELLDGKHTQAQKERFHVRRLDNKLTQGHYSSINFALEIERLQAMIYHLQNEEDRYAALEIKTGHSDYQKTATRVAIARRKKDLLNLVEKLKQA